MRTPIFRRISGLVSILLLIAFAISCKRDDVNRRTEIISNNSVEESAESTIPNPWYKYSGSTGNFVLEWTKEEASSGSRSIKITSASTEVTDLAYWGQQYSGAFPNGKEMTMTVKIKGKNLIGNGISITLIANDSNDPLQLLPGGMQGTDNVPLRGTFDWYRFTSSSSMIYSDGKCPKYLYVQISLTPGTSGIAYFDDIHLSY